jgi:hypothetical protein
MLETEVSFYRDVRDKQPRPATLQQVYEWIQSDAYTMAKTMAHRAAVESGEMGVADACKRDLRVAMAYRTEHRGRSRR